LDLEDDQYEVYYRITTAIGHRHNQQAYRFFITGPAGTGKSFLFETLEKWLASYHISVLKMAPTGIAACAIGGKTIHSALNIAQSG
jgi:DNA replication protein DnaC